MITIRQAPVSERADLAHHNLVGNALPIIGLSGLEEGDDVDTCIAAGMNEFITKPVRFARILEVLAAYRA